MRRQHILLAFILTGALALASSIFGQAAGAPAAAKRVLIAPFSMADLPESQRWMPKSIQDNLVSSFSRTLGYAAVPYKGAALVDDNATAQRLAKSASANFAVRGSAVLENDSIHLTAQLVDAKTGEALSSADVSGPAVNLLKLEDQLSAQLRSMRAAADHPAVPAPEASVASAETNFPSGYAPIPEPPAYIPYSGATPLYTPYLVPHQVGASRVPVMPFIDRCIMPRGYFIANPIRVQTLPPIPR